MNRNLYKIDHIVVLMMENRSFDNMAGWLYDPGNPPPFDKVPRNQPFDGLSGKNLSNPIPVDVQSAGRKYVPAGKEIIMTNPNPNPGEKYAHINTQLYGRTIPPNNIGPKFREPYNLPSPVPFPAPMNGFVKDYINILKALKKEITYDNYKIIMNCLTPDQVPVISTLANSYAVCDRWFCSVPSQTFPNRAFLQAATSNGLVNNTPYLDWVKNDTDTIFNRVQDAGKPDLTWKVYYDKLNILPFSWILHRKLHPYFKTNFSGMKQFEKDAAEGTLPSYSFIEPSFMFINNDQHPQDPFPIHLFPSNVLAGEALINRVYQALRKGKNWERTLFIITYDEHGGLFDHVPPPKAVPPDKNAPAGQFGFKFDRLGPRVCTVLVSPYIEPGTVFRAKNVLGRDIPLEHNSITKTIELRWHLKPLTERDRASEDISGVLTLSKPRTDYPEIKPRPYPTPLDSLKDKLIPQFIKDLIGLTSARLAVRAPEPGTMGEAVEFLERCKDKLLRLSE